MLVMVFSTRGVAKANPELPLFRLVQHDGDVSQGVEESGVGFPRSRCEARADLAVVGVLEPLAVLGVAASLVALPAGCHHVLDRGGSAILPEHEVVHGEGDAVFAAVATAGAVGGSSSR